MFLTRAIDAYKRRMQISGPEPHISMSLEAKSVSYTPRTTKKSAITGAKKDSWRVVVVGDTCVSEKGMAAIVGHRKKNKRKGPSQNFPNSVSKGNYYENPTNNYCNPRLLHGALVN